MLLQAAQSQHPQQLAARSTRRFPATKEDACLMASKTAPNVKVRTYIQGICSINHVVNLFCRTFDVCSYIFVLSLAIRTIVKFIGHAV